jgi:hypothetical protein
LAMDDFKIIFKKLLANSRSRFDFYIKPRLIRFVVRMRRYPIELSVILLLVTVFFLVWAFIKEWNFPTDHTGSHLQAVASVLGGALGAASAITAILYSLHLQQLKEDRQVEVMKQRLALELMGVAKQVLYLLRHYKAALDEPSEWIQHLRKFSSTYDDFVWTQFPLLESEFHRINMSLTLVKKYIEVSFKKMRQQVENIEVNLKSFEAVAHNLNPEELSRANPILNNHNLLSSIVYLGLDLNQANNILPYVRDAVFVETFNGGFQEICDRILKIDSMRLYDEHQ